MKKLLQFNWLNYITYFIQVILFFVLCIYVPAPPPTMTDHGLGDVAVEFGKMIFLIFLFILFIITSLIYATWIINTKGKKAFLIVINVITFMFLLPEVISGFPYIIKESKNGCFSLINEYRRNQSISGKDNYQQIKFDGYSLRFFLCTKDTNLLYVRDTIKESKKEKYYLLRGAVLQEIKKEKIAHLLKQLNFDEQLIFSEGCEGRPLVVIPENNQISQKFGRTKLDYDDDPFNEENLPTVKIWNEFEDIKNAGELKGFKEFMPIPQSGKKDKNGTLYFLFWYLSKPGAVMNWDGDINQEASLCLCIRKKGGEITVREINLNAILEKERAVFYECMAVEDFIVSGNYYYIIVDRKLYCHKNR